MTRRKTQSICHCINLRRTAGAVTEFYEQHLKTSRLTLNQYSLMTNLSRLGQASVSDLARQVGLDRTTLTRTLKPLLDNGLIEDTSNPNQRNKTLKLSQPGSNTLELAKPLWQRAQNEIEAVLGLSNLKQMTMFLFRLENLRKPEK